MKHTLLSLLLCIFGLALQPASLLAADRNDGWKRLGQKEVDHKAERDEINVGADEGLFKKIKLEVHKADVDFINVRIVYASGDDQEVEIRNNIKAGGETRTIDLDGRNRAIKKVLFIYKTDRNERRRATVTLYGRN